MSVVADKLHLVRAALRECCGEHRSCDESKTFVATLLDVRTYSVVDVSISWVTVSTFLLAGLGLESSLLPMNGLQGLLNLVDIIMTSVIVSNVNSINDKNGYSYINDLIDANEEGFIVGENDAKISDAGLTSSVAQE